MIFKRFFPTYKFQRLENIPYAILKSENIKGIIFDMDNTLVDYRYKFETSTKIWIDNMMNKGIKFIILSNTPRTKVAKMVAEKLNMPYITNASKPRRKGFVRAVEALELNKENVAIIGDQIFTDVYGGNRFGIKTILVEPINKKEIFIAKIKRPIENIIMSRYHKHKKEND